jgi:hypothetical protein
MSLRHYRFITWLCLLFGLPLCYSSPLEWDTEKLAFEVESSQREVPFAFKFKNGTGFPIRIISTKASCGCTVTGADLAQQYNPGEFGKISGVYNVSGVGAVKTVSIRVEVEVVDGATSKLSEDELKLTVSVFQRVKILPGVLIWKRGAEHSEKRVTLEVSKGEPMELSIESLDTDVFSARLVTVNKGRAYEILAQPKVIQEPSLGVITVKGKDSDGQERFFTVYLFVK